MECTIRAGVQSLLRQRGHSICGAAFSTYPLWKTALWRFLVQTTLFSLNLLQIQIGVLKEFTPLECSELLDYVK